MSNSGHFFNNFTLKVFKLKIFKLIILTILFLTIYPSPEVSAQRLSREEAMEEIYQQHIGRLNLIQDLKQYNNKNTPQLLRSVKAAPEQPIRLVESRSHGSDALENYIREHDLQISSRMASGSSLKICLVAEGTVDIYPRLAPTMEWDVAAGDAIYRYSGAPTPHSSELKFNKKSLLNPSFVYGF